MIGPSRFPELNFRDTSIPGGTFVNALWHRDLMRLSDRGRASEHVGARWADICAAYLATLTGVDRDFEDADDLVESYRVLHIARLDDVPAIARTASRHHLQNPDFLVVGDRGGISIVQSADAKFSVETAKSKQVSAEVAASLIDLGAVVTNHLPSLSMESTTIEGFFLCPDFSLTHYMMQRTRGPRGSVSVPAGQIELVPVTVSEFMSGLRGHTLALWLAGKDQFPIPADESLLVFLYYYRLARACVGCWIDQTAPLLSQKELPVEDEVAILQLATRVGAEALSGWDVVRAWDVEAEYTRRQRAAVDSATSLPISSAELRSTIEKHAKVVGIDAPSQSKVRRQIGSWFRNQIRLEYGDILPPIDDFAELLKQLTESSRQLRPALLGEIKIAVHRAATPESDDTTRNV